MGLVVYDLLYTAPSRSSLTLFMSVIFYFFRYISDLPFWFIFGMTITNAFGIPILFFAKCGVTEDINLGFQIFYHLLPLELSLSCLSKFNTIPPRWIFLIIFILHLMFDTMLYKYDILTKYECTQSEETGVILLYVLDIVSNILVYITTLFKKKKEKSKSSLS